jgi:hypothetical protein
MLPRYCGSPQAHVRRLSSTTLVLLCISACDRSPGSSADVDRIDSAGVEIVQRKAVGKIPELSWTVDTIPLLTFGGEGDTAATFGSIARIVRRTDGSVIVLDYAPPPPLTVSSEGLTMALAPQVRPPRIFDSTGKLVAQVGRKGKGPGEYHDITFVVALPGSDSIFIYDPQLNVGSIFAPSGAFVRRVTFPELVLFGSMRGIMRDGMVVFDVPQSLQNPYAKSGVNYLRFGLDGKVRDTLALNLARWNATQAMLWYNGSVVSVGASTLYFASNRSYDIQVHGIGGKLVRILRPGIPPRAATSEEIARYKQRENAAESARGASGPTPMQEFREKAPVPNPIPEYTSMIEDPSGNLWALEFRPVEDVPERWLVFDRTGALIGAVMMPADWTVMQIGSDFVAASIRGDVERVGIFQLRKR